MGGRELSILLVKNPAGANEVLRTLALEPGEHDVLAVLNDNIADGRDVSLGLGRRLRAARRRACGASTCGGTRAAEMALRLKYAGVDPARIDGRARARRGARRRARRRRRRALFALPTYTAMLALRDLLVARGAVPGVVRDDAPTSSTCSGTTSSAAPTRTTCRCGASWPRAAGGPVLDLGAGTGRVALDLARAGHEVVALDLDAGLLAALRDARRRPAGRRPSRPTRASFDLGAPLRR